MPNERCFGAMEQQIKDLEKRVEDVEEKVEKSVTNAELDTAITRVTKRVTDNYKTVMAVVTPLHEMALKSRGFINGMLFVVTAVSGIFAVAINYLLDHFKN